MFYGHWLALLKRGQDMVSRLGLAIMDRRTWRPRAHWYGVVALLGSAVFAGIAAFASRNASSGWIIFITSVSGAVAAQFALWIGTVVYKLRRPELRFTTRVENARPGVPNTHGVTASIGRHPLGYPQWEIVYPNGDSGLIRRDEYADLAVHKERGGQYNFDFSRRDQEGPFIIRFRGRVRERGRIVTLNKACWYFTKEGGWDRC